MDICDFIFLEYNSEIAEYGQELVFEDTANPEIRALVLDKSLALYDALDQVLTFFSEDFVPGLENAAGLCL